MSYTKAIIFDCDGTLVDTEIMSARIDVMHFAAHGIRFESPEAYLAEFMGVAKKDIIAFLNQRHGIAMSAEEFEEDFAQLMVERIPSEMNFFPESVSFVQSLGTRGVPMAVASNGQRTAVLAELRHAGYLGVIHEGHVVAVGDVTRPKPAPDMYIEAAQRLGVAAADCIVVEDSVPGARAGVAAGMTVLGYTGFSHDRDKAAQALQKAGCAHIINSLSEIAPFVAR